MIYQTQKVPFETVLGKTFRRVYERNDTYEDQLVFEVSDSERYIMRHEQECCETISLEDVCGNLLDLEGCPITKAMEISEEGAAGTNGETSTWTFYRIATEKGLVVLRWRGQSNGCYSERVDLYHCLSGAE